MSNVIRTAARAGVTVGASVALAAGAGAAGPVMARAATVPAASVAPAVTSCAVQLSAINAAERGAIGARGLAAAGLPDLARDALAARSLYRAMEYGANLEATLGAILGGRGHCTGGAGAPALPRWFRWGNTSDRDRGAACIVVWGGRGNAGTGRGAGGGTSAEICADGFAASS